jgi:hypothetical protein
VRFVDEQAETKVAAQYTESRSAKEEAHDPGSVELNCFGTQRDDEALYKLVRVQCKHLCDTVV